MGVKFINKHMRRKSRVILSLGLLTLVIAVALYYFLKHKYLLKQLTKTPFHVSLAVFGLYIVMFGALMLILQANLAICNLRFKLKENVLLNSHSLFINFFIPGQGGPAYRGAYLYQKYKLKIRNYIVATLLYYAFYAVVSIVLVLSERPWWQIVLGVLLAAGFSTFVLNRYVARKKIHKDDLVLSKKNVLFLLLATILQACVQIAIYSVELKSVNHSLHFSQIIIYTGAANLALFVSLTPGAIGIRESFLLFTRHLHHVSSGNILVANLIDRSVYIVFLLVLIVLTIAIHLRGRFTWKQLPSLIKQSLKLPSAKSEPVN